MTWTDAIVEKADELRLSEQEVYGLLALNDPRVTDLIPSADEYFASERQRHRDEVGGLSPRRPRYSPPTQAAKKAIRLSEEQAERTGESMEDVLLHNLSKYPDLYEEHARLMRRWQRG